MSATRIIIIKQLINYEKNDVINGVHPDNCDDPYFTTVEGEGTSRGLGYTEWAKIDCN